MKIKAIFYKPTKEILYSRATHDCRWSSDGKVSVDGGFEYFKFAGDLENVIMIEIDSDLLLRQILYYDWNFHNSNANKFKEGYHGRFQITDRSDLDFFRRLVVNFSDIEEYL